MTAAPRVEFLWWQGCPSHPDGLAQLEAELAAVGLDPDSVERIEIETDEEAKAAHFVGSPTVRINGEDVAETGDDNPALTCRVYRLRDGRISPLPDRADIRAALGAAVSMKGD